MFYDPLRSAVVDMIDRVTFTNERQQSKVKYPLAPSIFRIIMSLISF
ncbi:hypothetical protein [Anaerobiospirillum thomasii]|nr:hypothetical protein [Anaerobiospirillum thomasii]